MLKLYRRALLMMAAPWLGGCLAFHSGPMEGEPADATFATIDGARIRFRDEGTGPAVVLVHGFASSLETWAAVTPALRERHRVLSLDLKGFGWSDRPEGDYSPEAQARIVLALMDARGIDRADFVAHSYGASIVLQLALIAPERVGRIAIYDGWAYSSQLPAFFHVARAEGFGEAMFAAWYGERVEDRLSLAFYDRSFVTMQLVDDVEAALRRPGTYASALAAVRAMHYERLEPRYREIHNDVLLLWGREDRVTPLAVGERLSRDLPGARMVVYPRCGHFPMIEHAAQSTAELARFLDAPRDEAASAAPVTSGGEVPVAPAREPEAPDQELGGTDGSP